MLSKEGQVTASPSVKLLSPTGLVGLQALKAPPQLDEGGRRGPCQEDWAHEDGGSNQCNDKVRHAGVPFGVGHQRWAMVKPMVPEGVTLHECSPPLVERTAPT
jgi:hypothetical protein